MFWFKSKKKVERELVTHNATVEIVAGKDDLDKAKKQAQHESKKLNDLLVENHFSLKIYVAAGGMPATKPKGGS